MIPDSSAIKSVFITGGTSGLGLELVKCFLADGYDVFTTGRDLKGQTLPGKRFHFIRTDFSDLRQVAESINNPKEQYPDFDIIINNAGVLSPPGFMTTGDGFEYTFQVDFLSHLLINEILLKNRKNRTPLTLISVTSPVYKYFKPGYILPEKNNFSPLKAYSESKRYLLYIGNYLVKKYPESNIKHFGFDPGVFGSGISRTQKNWFQIMYSIASPFMKSPQKVAKKLCEILAYQEIHNGLIYKSINDKGFLPVSDKEESYNFMEICSLMIERKQL
jgi:NAD(P)-dependent dehydrogenase (short-subunit alcohol dehydrogenase family)